MSDRPQPSNVEAEKAVIGALLIENDAYGAMGPLSAQEFFRDAHRKIFDAISFLLNSGRAADLVALKNELDSRGLLEDVGGPAYVASMVDGVPRSTNVKYYAEIVREKSRLRRLCKVGTALADAAIGANADSRELVTRTDQQLTDVAAGSRISVGPVALADGLPALMADLDRRVSRRGQIVGLPSGFPSVDLLTHGWQRRKMIVIAGQTSFGKSVLALQCALAAARSGARIIYYSFEMERQELEYRLWSSLSEIPLTRILWGNLTETEYAALSAAMESMHGLPLEIHDGAGRTVADAKAECRQIKADRGLDGVVFDHIQLMTGPGDSRYEMFAGISTGIKALATELDVPIWALSQLTLGGDREANREPQLDDLRECKSIGHDADIVAMLHPYNPKEARTEAAVVPMKLLFRKQRGGRLGLVTLNLERDYVRFVEAEAPAPVVKEAKARKSPSKW